MLKNSLRTLVGIIGLTALVGCGSSDSGDNAGGGGSGASCDPVAFATLNAAGSNAKVCSAFVQCLGSKCAEAAKECAGPDFASGKYTGTCAGYYDCVRTCDCQKACVDKCDPGTIACAECLGTKLSYGCTMPCASEVASCGAR
jgi:hypothetical protein